VKIVGDGNHKIPMDIKINSLILNTHSTKSIEVL